METVKKTTRRYKTRTEKKQAIISDTIKNGDVIGGVSGKRVTMKPMQTTGDTVTVCLNYPRDIKFYIPNNSGNKTAVVFHGNATNLRGKDKGIIPVGAYGVTMGVPREAWEWIKAHYPDNDLIKQGLLFEASSRNVRAEAEERVDLRHGFEPIDPKEAHNSEPYKG
nr:MAG TPA: hypothetical protein [Caudoviricetes sp.]